MLILDRNHTHCEDELRNDAERSHHKSLAEVQARDRRISMLEQQLWERANWKGVVAVVVAVLAAAATATTTATLIKT
jgi:hypothetical protein